MNQLQVVAPNLTNRKRYIFELLLGELLGLDLTISEDIADWNPEMPTLSYGASRQAQTTFIRAFGFLDQTGSRPVELSVRYESETPVFFETGDSDLSFDPFSAAFYLVSRYEDIMPHNSIVSKDFPLNKARLLKTVSWNFLW